MKKYSVLLLLLIMTFPVSAFKRHSGTDGGKDTPKKWGYEYSNITLLTRDGVFLSAWMIVQKKDNPWVILIPGFQDNKSDDKMRVAFKKLAPDRYNFILIDSRGFGKSGGVTSFGILEKNDVLAAVKYIRKKKYTAKIGLVGFSQGAAASILATAASDEISALAVWAPYSDFRDQIIHFIKWKFKNSKKKIIIWAKKHPDKVARIYERLYRVKLSENRPVDKIKTIKIPILLGQGKKDGLIPFYNSKKLFEANKSILYMKLSGGHSLYWQEKSERSKYLKRMSQLMKKNLW